MEKISVAMTTCNGETYIYKQIKSIAAQTKPPGEVVICDDASEDHTAEIITDFIEKNHLRHWNLVVNDMRLGWKRNFRKAIGLTSGDMVFFSDQDDIWFEDKIEIMERLMRQRNMGCLYGHNLKIDSEDHDLSRRDEKRHFSGRVTRIKFKPNFFTIKALGCSMGVSRRVIDQYLSIGCIEDDHDSQCARLAVLYDSLWRLDRPLLKHYPCYSGFSMLAGDFAYKHGINRFLGKVRWDFLKVFGF